MTKYITNWIMKRVLLSAVSICMAASLNLLSAQLKSDTLFDRSAHADFAFGADISWLSLQESFGNVFRDRNGVEKDLMVIMKEQGIDSFRFRVWVDPEGGWHGKDDMIYLAKRADDLGIRVMVNFHYSDSWADPGKQFKPAAWENYSFEELKDAVYDHTFDVLDSLKKTGITPEWVQIGNETKRGMLWPDGNTDNSGGMQNFAELVNSGYDAIKAVDSDIQAIVHLPDADDNGLYRWMFDGLESNGVQWDIIGMSAYPHWSHLDPETEINLAVANMKDMISRYDTKVMIVETGHQWYEPYVANNFLVDLMDTLLTFDGGGVFYWEPQYYGGWYEMGAWNPDTQQPTLAMDAFLGIKYEDPASSVSITIESPVDGESFDLEQSIPLTALVDLPDDKPDMVTFYVNEEPVAEVTSAPYSYEMPNPGTGVYSIYASVTFGENTVVESEPVTIQVGSIMIIQENALGFCGITDDAGSIDSDHSGYSGEGFVNGDNASGTTVNWAVDFLEAGTYQIHIRYASSSTRPGTVSVNDQNIGTAAFSSTGAWSTWEFETFDYTVTEAGRKLIAVSANEGDGLPNIDYLGIMALESAVVPLASGCEEEEAVLLAEEFTVDQLKIYPVPARTKVLVESLGEISTILIYRLDGVLVKSTSEIEDNQIEINTSDLRPGIYVMQIEYNGKTFSTRIQIED